MGQYDGVVISEFPSDEVVARGALGSGAMGFILTETMRAFTEDQYKKLLESLP
jgi:uncharacterized protein with GYD domain